jgi:hypothetical protein
VAAGCWIGLVACDSLTGSSDREEARVEVTPLASAAEVVLVTSTSFTVTASGVDLAQADTQTVSIPSNEVYRLNGENRFFVSVGPRVEGDTATVRMQVWIDGESWFSDTRTLGADSTETMTFVYRLRQPRF